MKRTALKRKTPLRKRAPSKSPRKMEAWTRCKYGRQEKVQREARETFLDRLWDRWARIPGRCAMCGRTNRDLLVLNAHLETHHVIHIGMGGGRTKLKWHPANALLLCGTPCHREGKCSPHGNPAAFDFWLRTHLPDQWEWMHEHLNDLGKPDYDEAERLLNDAIRAVQAGIRPEWQRPSCRQAGQERE